MLGLPMRIERGYIIVKGLIDDKRVRFACVKRTMKRCTHSTPNTRRGRSLPPCRGEKQARIRKKEQKTPRMKRALGADRRAARKR